MRCARAAVLATLLMGCFGLAVQPVRAAGITGITVLFDDLTDTITVSPASGRVVVVPGTCSASTLEFCEILLAPPSGNATITSTTVPLLNLIGEGSMSSGTPISDILASTAAATLPGAVFTFTSDSLEASLGTCGTTGTCNFAETSGNPVDVGTITWSDGTVDDIQFQSDFSDTTSIVPEPASLILLGSGLALAGGFLRRRRRPEGTSVV